MSNKRLEAFQALEYVPFIKEKKKKRYTLSQAQVYIYNAMQNYSMFPKQY